MTEQERIDAQMDEILGEDKKPCGPLSAAIASLKVLHTLCEVNVEDIHDDPCAAVMAIQDSTKGIVESVLSYLDAEMEDRNENPVKIRVSLDETKTRERVAEA